MNRLCWVLASGLAWLPACGDDSSGTDDGGADDSGAEAELEAEAEADADADAEPEADVGGEAEVPADVEDDATDDGGPAQTELRWDDGVCEMTNGPGGDTVPGGMIAACFEPPAYPAALLSARFYVAGSGVPTTAFGIRIFRGDGSGGRPGTEIAIPATTGAAAGPHSWTEVDLSPAAVTIEAGSFCVAMEWLTPFGSDPSSPPTQLLCSDNDDPIDGRSWIRWAAESAWHSFDEIGVRIPTDVMIRATVEH